MKTAIIKYNAGNTQSVIYSLKRLGIEPELTSSPEKLQSADRVIFPGVGEASTTMEHLDKLGLIEVIQSLKQPVLGICLGLQLMCEHSEENNTRGMGIFPVKVRKFSEENGMKIPHMGWNTLKTLGNAKLTQGITPEDHAYFVHSYYAELSDYSIITTHYGHEFSAGLEKDNFMAVQFHPEKSAETGEKILKNFLGQ